MRKSLLFTSLVAVLCVPLMGFNNDFHTSTISDIPRGNYTELVADMTDQEWAWIEPFNMWVDQNGNCWVNETGKVSGAQKNSDQIIVWKGGNGFTVDIHGTNFIWARGTCAGAPGGAGCQAVVKIIDSQSAIKAAAATKIEAEKSPTTKP